MNCLLLHPEEVTSDNTVRLTGRRHLHARDILKASTGDVLRVGLLNGPLGTAQVLHLDENELRLALTWTSDPPPRPGVDLVLAVPRPKALKKVLPAIASLGVDRLFLVNAARVEKSYFDSKVLAPDFMRSLLIEGLEQAQDTVLPRVELQPRFRPFVEDSMPSLFSEHHERWVPHPSAERRLSSLTPQPAKRVLAIGPEGGWVPFEIELLQKQGFQPISLGPRILRVEVAVSYLLGAFHT